MRGQDSECSRVKDQVKRAVKSLSLVELLQLLRAISLQTRLEVSYVLSEVNLAECHHNQDLQDQQHRGDLEERLEHIDRRVSVENVKG